MERDEGRVNKWPTTFAETIELPGEALRNQVVEITGCIGGHAMKDSKLWQRAGIVVVLTWVSIELHEMGHFLVYTLAGYHARMSLQRVTPIGDVPPVLDHWAKLGGPALSLVAAVIFLIVARRRPGFAWVTASFTNASLRLFPCVMDLLRAVKGAHPFSDEGEVALALTSSSMGRTSLILFAIALALGLTYLAGREYHFKKRAFFKCLVIYSLSLAVGISVVLLDEIMGWSK